MKPVLSIMIALLVLGLALPGVFLSGSGAQVVVYGNSPITGALIPSAAEIAHIREWQPTRMAWASSPVIDLRYDADGKRQVPAVGRQLINDCVGWAVSYAKSYVEAIEHRWEPVTSTRIFSPSWIYNQINGGQNNGGYIHSALDLLKTRGGATLATMPYTTDYRKTPPSTALQEAARYRNREYYSVRSLMAIKQALAQGHPVVVGIVTDKEFMSGRFDIYNQAIRSRATRDPLNAHGRHAMVILGYDDIRGALLFLNSWGTAWGKEGYAWISYDVIGTIAYDSQERNFMECAYVMIDDRSTDAVRPGSRDFEIIGRSVSGGLSAGVPAWNLRAHIKADSATLDTIRQVSWQVPDGFIAADGTVKTSAEDNFEIVGRLRGTGTHVIRAVVSFRDGTSATRSFTWNLAAATRGALVLEQTDKYYGKIGNRDYWNWWLRIRGSLNDLADIEQVTYHLVSTYPDPNPVVRASATNGFAYSARGWEPFTVRATVKFKDGTSRALSTRLAFRDQPRTRLVLKNSAVPYREDDRGNTWYSWTAFIDGPASDLARVQKVVYYLHPSFRNNVHTVTGGAGYGFPFSATGWGTFVLRAKVHMNDGSVRDLSHRLDFTQQ